MLSGSFSSSGSLGVRLGWDGLPSLTAPRTGLRDSSTMNMRNYAFGAGCGAVSALLFAVIATSSPLAFPLYLVAPLPILIATLGFTHHAGLTAALVASLLTSLVFSPLAGFVHAISIGFPSWFLGYLALLARPSEDPTKSEWYPLGRLLMWNVAIAVVLTFVGALMLGSDYASFVSSFEELIGEMIALEPALFGHLATGDQSSTIASIANFMALLAGPVSAAISVTLSVLLLYIAARIVRASGRLPRPWPDLATITLPKIALPVVLLCLMLTATAPDFAGLFGRIGFAALLIAFCLQGLAVLHKVTRPIKSRRAILVMIYSVFVLLPGWPILGFALLGMADVWFNFRSRFPAAEIPSP